MPTNYERDLLLATRGAFRSSVDIWASLHNKWSFDMRLMKNVPVYRMTCILNQRSTKWFEKQELAELIELIHLLETRFKMTSQRWILDGKVEYKLWLKGGLYERQRKELEERKSAYML